MAGSRAFTLIEVVVALTILGLITGALFAIIQGSVRGAAEIERVQRENDSISRFLDLCRKTFTTLPRTAVLTLTLVEDQEPVQQELTIAGSPNCFGFGLSPISYKDTILGLRPDPNGLTDQNGALIQYLSLSREDLIPQTDENEMAIRQEVTGLAAPDEQGRHWMPLLPEVVSLRWRFYVAKDDTWVEEWDDSDWPDLIEVQLVMKDRTIPVRMVYSVPVLELSPARQRSSGTSNSSNTNTQPPSSNSSSGGGGGGGGRGSGGGGNEGRGDRPGGNENPRQGGNTPPRGNTPPGRDAPRGSPNPGGRGR